MNALPHFQDETMLLCLRRWLAAGVLLMLCGPVVADDASTETPKSPLYAPAIDSAPTTNLNVAVAKDVARPMKNVKPPQFSFFPNPDLEAPLSLVGHQGPMSTAGSHVASASFPAPTALCCVPPWVHRSGVFGEGMLLRARNSDTAYAAVVNGTVPAGSTGVLDSEFDFGYRVGLTKAFDRCHSIVATYTGFISDNTDQIAGSTLSKLLIHPDALNAASNALTASGRTALDFHVFDLDYRFLLHGNDYSAINMLIGARYAHMEQEIDAMYQTVGNLDAVSSEIDFDGAGLRLGLDAEHHVGHGLYGYGKANASFLAGEFDASYLNTRDNAYVSSNDFNTARLVTILDVEVGAGWQATQHCRISAGYAVSGWFNSITTADWIDGVRDNNHFADMSQAITFDGFNARAELRF